MGAALRIPRRAHAGFRDPRAAQAARQARHHLVRGRHSRPRAVPGQGGAGGLYGGAGRRGARGLGPAIFGERGLSAAAPVDRAAHGVARRGLRRGQHRRHLGLAAGAGVSGPAAALARRHRAGDGAHLSRCAAGVLRVRAALRRASPRGRQPHAAVVRGRCRGCRWPREVRLRRSQFRQPDGGDAVAGRAQPAARSGRRARHPHHRGFRLRHAALRGREPGPDPGAGSGAPRQHR